MDESRSKLEESLSLSKKMVEADPQHYNSIAVTTTYNLARIFEAQCQFQKAEIFYKDILKEHPNYIDCTYTPIILLYFCAIELLQCCIGRYRLFAFGLYGSRS